MRLTAHKLRCGSVLGEDHPLCRNTLMAWPFIDVCENNYPMVARSIVMVIVRERQHVLSWRMPRAQVDGFLPKFGRPDSLHVSSRYPWLTCNFVSISRHLWMLTWAIANLTKEHLRRETVRFLLPLLSFSPVWVVVCYCWPQPLTANPFSTSPMDPGIGGAPNE